MSIVRIGLGETKNFAEGYEAIFGKKEKKEEEKEKQTKARGKEQEKESKQRILRKKNLQTFFLEALIALGKWRGI